MVCGGMLNTWELPTVYAAQAVQRPLQYSRLMSMKLGYREIHALTIEQLVKRPKGQHAQLTEDVLTAGEAKGLISGGQPGFPGTGLSHQDQERVSGWVQEALWDCLLKRMLMFGMDGSNPNWPFYRLTDHGESALRAGTPQPYDPDGFIAYFDGICPTADLAVRGYLAEAVAAFNAGCVRAAAVMLGCASEKLLLLLCDALEAAISDGTKKVTFTKELEAKRAISHRYATLHDRLERMVAAKKLPREHVETVGSELPSGYELLRRCRNSAGHPEVPGVVDPDTVFMNLRTFIEYGRRVTALVEHFLKEPADW